MPAVLVFMVAGLQLPVIVFREELGSDGATAFWQSGPIAVKLGTCLFYTSAAAQ